MPPSGWVAGLCFPPLRLGSLAGSGGVGNPGRKSDAAFRMGGYRVLITRSSLARSVQENTVSLRPPLRLGSLAGSGGAGNPGDGTFQQ